MGDTGHNQSLYEGKDCAQYIQPQKKEQNLSYFFKINAAGSGDLGYKSVKQLRRSLSGNLGSDDPKHGTSDRKK